ncbi:hypothetical protein [Aquirhabdus parva]|nr:hypothetical protein [Aquirhabdus parva]
MGKDKSKSDDQIKDKDDAKKKKSRKHWNELQLDQLIEDKKKKKKKK